MFCSLVKTTAQFEENGCENCAFLDMKADRNRVLYCTSPTFDGIIAMMDPPASWVAKWQRIGKFVRGCYAIQVQGKVADEIMQELSKHNLKYQPRVKN